MHTNEPSLTTSLYPMTWTPEQITEEFKRDILELGDTPFELVERMAKLGDRRSYETILRSVQRMLSGETRVSGEMKALVRMLLRQRRRSLQQHKHIAWSRLPDGSHTAQIGEFRTTLLPQTRGRWLVNLVRSDGYSPSWPRWQDNLEAAKIRAVIRAEEAIDEVLEYDALLNASNPQ